MNPETGKRVIEVAKSLIGSHYINGAYGATPGKEDGCPCRAGGVRLIADPSRLDPKQNKDPTKNLAVFAADMTVKKYCVCAGNYASFSGGREAKPTDQDLINYLASLKGKPPSSWQNYYGHYTPRRAYGPGPGGDLGGQLVWGQSCKGIRHFDCVGFISFCLWKATGSVQQLDISAWRTEAPGRKVYDIRLPKKGEAPPPTPKPHPGKLQDGDILVKADHHIGYVDAGGTIIEAQDTHLGVRSSSGFNVNAPGSWTHLVRIASPADVAELAWPYGWWKVWDGNTYFYYFADGGRVQYTKSSPYNTRTPPQKFVNQGTFTFTPPKTIVVTWNKVDGAADNCVETFYNAESGCDQMNANSNLYGPLVATRMA